MPLSFTASLYLPASTDFALIEMVKPGPTVPLSVGNPRARPPSLAAEAGATASAPAHARPVTVASTARPPTGSC